jgi:excisionase family DNA binding protein
VQQNKQMQANILSEAVSGIGASDALRRWVEAARDVEAEFDQGPEYYESSARIDKIFLAFLRVNSRFGIFSFGPITIHVPTVEAAVEESVRSSVPSGGLASMVMLSDIIQAEVKRGGGRRVDELHLLLAFMRIGMGVPARVFGELGVTPQQVEEFARNGDSTRVQMEDLFSPEEAAVYLKVHVQTVRDWIRTGRLKASRLAGQRSLRIRASDLQSVLEPLEPEPGPRLG